MYFSVLISLSSFVIRERYIKIPVFLSEVGIRDRYEIQKEDIAWKSLEKRAQVEKRSKNALENNCIYVF